ncbi:MAG: hypothetical protein R3B98_00540 [Hyphomonas sp.]
MDRKISAGILGWIVAVAMLMTARHFGHIWIPGAGAEPADSVAATPFLYRLVEACAWYIGTQSGVWMALVLSGGSRRATIIVAGGMLAIITMILLSTHYPAWMVAIGLLSPVLSVYLATRLKPFEPI